MPLAFIMWPTIALSPEVLPALALPHNICVSETYDSSLSGGLVTYFHMSPVYVIALQPCVIVSLVNCIYFWVWVTMSTKIVEYEVLMAQV